MSILCNCYHTEDDHHHFSQDGEVENKFYAWCIYSEHGQCPCDCFTPMDNLTYLEWMSETKRHDKAV